MQKFQAEEHLAHLAACTQLVNHLSHPDLLEAAQVTLGPVQQLLAAHKAKMQAL